MKHFRESIGISKCLMPSNKMNDSICVNQIEPKAFDFFVFPFSPLAFPGRWFRARGGRAYNKFAFKFFKKQPFYKFDFIVAPYPYLYDWQ